MLASCVGIKGLNSHVGRAGKTGLANDCANSYIPPWLDPAMPESGTKYWLCLTPEQDSPPGRGNLGGRPFLLVFSLKALLGEVEGQSWCLAGEGQVVTVGS